MVEIVKKILINIKNNDIIFSYKTNNSTISNDLINTNIISNNELIFSDIYIKENTKILSSFIKELSIQYHITRAIISKMELANIVINLISKATNIESIYIKDYEPLTFLACEAITKLEHIKHLNCYTVQPFMLELLDKSHITCETRNEILYISNFMEKNNLLKYSNIYYKTNVRIEFPLSLEDFHDFEDFCKINKYLKVVHLNKLSNTELENIIKILTSTNKSNIKIVIHENINDEKKINYLKDLNKNSKKKKVYLSLEYSKDYLDQNIISQTIVIMLKVCGLIISSLVILVITYIGIFNYVSLKEVDSIKDDLKNIVDKIDESEIKDLVDKKNKDNVDNYEENPTKPNEPNIAEPPNIKLITNMNLASLLSVNEDVIGELKVNNTSVDYPVVQAKDNKYYLKKNINKKDNKNGWIFMDYRNDAMNLDRNNIIYGHNMYYSGVMFGTLYKAANKSWYTNPENQIITYNTLYDNMQFKIFSIYRIPVTSDYLKVFFKDDKDFLEFTDMITKRSIHNFKVPIKASDKILTLSTCSDNGNKRLVIHAVLINKETSE